MKVRNRLAEVFAVQVLSMAVLGCANAKPSADRQLCKEHLQANFESLHKYMAQHVDVPRDHAGAITPAIITTSLGIEASCSRGHDRASYVPYILNPKLSKDAMNGRTILMICNNHTDANAILALFGDGRVETILVSSDERDRWVQRFIDGEEEATTK